MHNLKIAEGLLVIALLLGNYGIFLQFLLSKEAEQLTRFELIREAACLLLWGTAAFVWFTFFESADEHWYRVRTRQFYRLYPGVRPAYATPID